VLLAYFIFIGYHAVTGVTYAQWSALHDSVAVRVFTLMAVLSFAAHAWIGMWAVFTDYLTERMLGARGNVLRLAVQIATVLAIFALVLWVIEILWQ
jgi:succinate dehydrogenase / fumarate reductase membrane anchor subunit